VKLALCAPVMQNDKKLKEISHFENDAFSNILILKYSKFVSTT
jgi:hypothetical protein